jgi:predicted TIM-barrel fold metal-dependent hydrolase
MIIDIVTHVMLPKYKERVYKYSSKFPTEKAVQDRRPVLTDYEARVEKLAKYGNIVQVINTTMPPIEELVGPEEAADLARLCNDEMAELVAKYPKYFIAAAANLPLNDIDASSRRQNERSNSSASKEYRYTPGSMANRQVQTPHASV